MPRLSLRFYLVLAFAMALLPIFVRSEEPKTSPATTEYFKGKIVPVADLVAKAGSRLDPDAAPHWLALDGEDGKIYPLVKDSGSRMFFKDPALQNRPLRLTGRLLPGSQLLRVTAAHSFIKGQLHEIYYWCDICSIRRGEKNICECCGGPMVLHEDPVKK